MLSLFRHILTTLGGFLVGKGYLDATAAPELIGALVTIAGVAWGWFSARQKSTLKDAVNGQIDPDHPKVIAALK